MPASVYSEINLHITFHTKGNLPLIKPEIEIKLYQFLKRKIIETPEVYFHAVGGIEDHVHFAVSVPPSLLISEWIGKLKGGSSYEINQMTNRKSLQWQRGYGIVSFGTKDLQWVINYILNQKEHHKKGTIYERLEKVTDDEDES
jgi:putative transposase